MIRVDTVYQKVLALANKEQRGYITPQDFNLFANQAQMEIFEQYFYDVNIARKTQGNDTVYSDVDDILEEKLQIFDSADDGPTIDTYLGPTTNKTLPDYIYRVYRVEHKDFNCEILNTKDFNDCSKRSLLLKPTNARPIVNIRNNSIRCMISNNTLVRPSNIFYFRVPRRVNWTYVVVNKKAMYNAHALTADFELHPSEENQVINKILMLAGVANKQQDIMQAGQGMEMSAKNQQPKI